MKRFLFLLTAILFSCSFLFAQEAEPELIPESEKDYVDEQNMTVTEVEELIQSQSAINRLDFVFGVAPIVSINTHVKDSSGKFISAPSPITFPLYFGLSIPNYTAISFQPTLRFFPGYNLVYGELVLPAEIENRTSLTLNFLVNLPIVFKLNYKNKFSWSILAGVAGLFRFAMPPINVDPAQAGTTGTIKTDVDYMNKWFYKNVRFLYLSAGIDWLFYYGKTKYGPELAVFFPISAITDKSFDALMISAGIKVEF
ncbi:MAG: hypothetical protein J5726_03855 [Treponema sp.]|nr:hypothetical protein [Treponema sp.]